jgi:hypothetical protein
VSAWSVNALESSDPSLSDHGTVYASRFKRMRESIEAMKEIWTKSETRRRARIILVAIRP